MNFFGWGGKGNERFATDNLEARRRKEGLTVQRAVRGR
jgi:hypothetical protein